MALNLQTAAQDLLLFCFHDDPIRLQQEICSVSDGFLSVEVLTSSLEDYLGLLRVFCMLEASLECTISYAA
jgi:hypothetical protein